MSPLKSAYPARRRLRRLGRTRWLVVRGARRTVSPMVVTIVTVVPIAVVLILAWFA